MRKLGLQHADMRRQHGTVSLFVPKVIYAGDMFRTNDILWLEVNHGAMERAI